MRARNQLSRIFRITGQTSVNGDLYHVERPFYFQISMFIIWSWMLLVSKGFVLISFVLLKVAIFNVNFYMTCLLLELG